MDNLFTYIAHVSPQGKIQSLEDHLNGSGEFASQFASQFGYEEWGKLLGELHDIGKYSPEFQNYILQHSVLEDDNYELSGKVDHSTAGAIFADKEFGAMGRPLSYCIAGHHSGLLNYQAEPSISGDMQSRLKKDSLDRIKNIIDTELPTKMVTPSITNGYFSKNVINVWVRMLYSCLVDADYLDTERFMQPDVFSKRGSFESIEALKTKFDAHMNSMLDKATTSTINTKRAEILQNCREAAIIDKNHFNLTVPTGGGKTLSSLAFALDHAVKYNKRRIIVVIPYTSIITQTAKVFKDIVGNDNVIEHHSNIETKTITQEQKQATENWDAPIIVTTNVQFFESLYACRSSHCRKLHNIVNSVVILDEAQMLPANFLNPILSVLNTLMTKFKVTALFTTATQPLLYGNIGSGKDKFEGLSTEPYNIVTNAESLANELKRVDIEIPNNLDETTSYDDLAIEIVKYDQVLCIVNTRKDSQLLFSKLPADTLHLSRMMCSAHILDTIEEIKRRLKNNEPIRVISTQLIEAGVDIDFPIVFRAFAGLDSIAQAAGRCNREGKLNAKGKLGQVKVFVPESGIPQGYMKKGTSALRDILSDNKEIDLLNPSIQQQYFQILHSKITNFDIAKIEAELWGGERSLKFQFATAAQRFKLIDDSESVSIVVEYGDGVNYINLLKDNGLETWLLRKLQLYTVSVRKTDFIELAKNGFISEIHGIWIQSDAKLYNSKSGVTLNNHWLEEILITSDM